MQGRGRHATRSARPAAESDSATQRSAPPPSDVAPAARRIPRRVEQSADKSARHAQQLAVVGFIGMPFQGALAWSPWPASGGAQARDGIEHVQAALAVMDIGTRQEDG
jgi:hypothetical protein